MKNWVFVSKKKNSFVMSFLSRAHEQYVSSSGVVLSTNISNLNSKRWERKNILGFDVLINGLFIFIVESSRNKVDCYIVTNVK